MQKRGQVTVFVVVGIIILLSLVAILAVKSFFMEEQGKTAEEQVKQASLTGSSVHNYIRFCLSEVAEDAILYVARHGGYYQLPPSSNEVMGLPFLYVDGESRLMTKEELQEQISSYVNNELSFCLRNFAPFKSKGYQINRGKVETSTTILPEKVHFDVKIPVEVTRGDSTQEMIDFSVSVPSKIGTIHSAILRFFERQMELPWSLCVSCLVGMMAENDLKVEINPSEEDIFIFTIADETLEYVFLAKYDFEDETI